MGSKSKANYNWYDESNSLEIGTGFFELLLIVILLYNQ